MGAYSLTVLAIAAGLALLVWRALHPTPQLQITERGILDRRLSLGWLDWDAIEGAYRPRSSNGERVLLRVRVDERLGRKIGRLTGQAQPTPRQLELPLDLSGTRYSEVEVLNEIMAHTQTSVTGHASPELEARYSGDTPPGSVPTKL